MLLLLLLLLLNRHEQEPRLMCCGVAVLRDEGDMYVKPAEVKVTQQHTRWVRWCTPWRCHIGESVNLIVCPPK